MNIPIEIMVTVALAGCGGLVWFGALTYNAGRHSQRLEAAEKDISRLKDAEDKAAGTHTELAVLAALMANVKEQVDALGTAVGKRIDQLEHDLRNVLSGKVQPARRSRSDNDA